MFRIYIDKISSNFHTYRITIPYNDEAIENMKQSSENTT